jgi:trehalose 6-phosphate synthase/phosphatase
MDHALNMPEHEIKRRKAVMRLRLQRYGVTRWAGDFLESLDKAREKQDRMKIRYVDHQVSSQIKKMFEKALRPVLFLDYDGTLVPFASRPELAIPDSSILEILKELQQKAEICIISGRDRAFLDQHFGSLTISLIAEHGIWSRRSGEDWSRADVALPVWKERFLPIFELFTDRLPGSVIEEKEYSLVWHYRLSPPATASEHARRFSEELRNMCTNSDLQVLPGQKVVELRPATVSKGTAMNRWIESSSYDFIMIAGDD